MGHAIRFLTAVTLTLLVAGCGDQQGPASAMPAHVDATALVGVYSGTFPCENCPAVDVRLWLRPDRVFFMRQDYRSSDSDSADRVHSLGEWIWNSDARTLVLRGRGPERRFEYLPDERLAFQTLSDLPHVLVRESAAAPFSDSLTLEGEFLSAGDTSTFRECLTGISVAVQDNAVGRDMRRQHRRMSAPDVRAVAILRGRFEYPEPMSSANTRLVVEELVSIKPKTRCPD